MVVPFDKILETVANHEVDSVVDHHEGQLTYGRGGLHNVIDLGRWFKQKYGLPLPLGGNALRRDLSPEVQAECSRLMRESIQYALDHSEEALNYAMQFARDLERRSLSSSSECTSTTTLWTAARSSRKRRKSCSILVSKQA